MTSQGHARTVFRRAIERENLFVAEATARELGQVSLIEALDLMVLVARKEPARHGRFAVRWLSRYLEKAGDVSLDEIGLVVAALAALPSRQSETAKATLRAVALKLDP